MQTTRGVLPPVIAPAPADAPFALAEWLLCEPAVGRFVCTTPWLDTDGGDVVLRVHAVRAAMDVDGVVQDCLTAARLVTNCEDTRFSVAELKQWLAAAAAPPYYALVPGLRVEVFAAGTVAVPDGLLGVIEATEEEMALIAAVQTRRARIEDRESRRYMDEDEDDDPPLAEEQQRLANACLQRLYTAAASAVAAKAPDAFSRFTVFTVLNGLAYAREAAWRSDSGGVGEYVTRVPDVFDPLFLYVVRQVR